MKDLGGGIGRTLGAWLRTTPFPPDARTRRVFQDKSIPTTATHLFSFFFLLTGPSKWDGMYPLAEDKKSLTAGESHRGRRRFRQATVASPHPILPAKMSLTFIHFLLIMVVVEIVVVKIEVEVSGSLDSEGISGPNDRTSILLWQFLRSISTLNSPVHHVFFKLRCRAGVIAYFINHALSLNALASIYLVLEAVGVFLLSLHDIRPNPISLSAPTDCPIPQVYLDRFLDTLHFLAVLIVMGIRVWGKQLRDIFTPRLEYDSLTPTLFGLWISLIFIFEVESWRMHKDTNPQPQILLETWGRYFSFPTFIVAFLLRRYHSARLRIRNHYENLHMKEIDFDRLPLYKYTDTKIQPGQIRLLVLKRRTMFSGLLDLVLIPLSLEASKQVGYEAMSYVWGNSDAKNGVLVNGQRFYVGDNLFALLHSRSSVWHARVLWVDAICINQSDSIEKTHQISSMKRIYQDSRRVVAWLEDRYDSWLAAWMVLYMPSVLFTSMLVSPAKRIAAMRITQPRLWAAYMRFCNHPYFSRAWIFQEMCVGDELEFAFGGMMLPFWCLRFAIDVATADATHSAVLGDPSSCTELGWGHFVNLSFIHNLRGRCRDLHPPLGLVLSYVAELQSQFAVDKIYAALGVSDTPLSRAIVPDPLRPAAELFSEVAVMLAESEVDAPYLFPFVGIGRPGRMDGIPTWVPDWTHAGRQTECGRLSFLDDLIEPQWHKKAYEHLEYHASGKSKPLFTVRRQDMALQVSGVVVDAIKRRTQILRCNGPGINYEDMEKWVQDAENMFQSMTATVKDNHADALEKFWRTLIGDRTGTLRFKPRDLGGIYPVFRKTLLEFSTNGKSLLRKKEDSEKLRTFISQWQITCGGRRFCTTENNRTGLIPQLACTGDVVCIIAGLQVPYILRPSTRKTSTRAFELIGECYIDGIMEGEAMNKSAIKKLEIV